MTRLHRTLACTLLGGWLVAAPAVSQTPETPWPSSEAYPHGRRVVDNTLISEGDPSFKIWVTEAFEYVGRTRFSLEERADAEVFLFGETHGGVITRYLQIQFEALRSHVEGGYKDTADETETIGGDEYMVRYWCFDRAAVAEENPESDVAHVQRMIVDEGLSTKGIDVGVRLIRLLGEGKRAEVLLIYGEQTALTGVDCGDEETAAEYLPAIRKRAFDSFELLPKAGAGVREKTKG